MPEVSAVNVSPTWAVPLMLGKPVAVVLALAATASVAALVRVSLFSASSVKETFTLIVLPWSASVSVWLEPLAPAMSVSSASHWYSKVALVSPSSSAIPEVSRRQRLPHLVGPADGGFTCGRGVLVRRGQPDGDLLPLGPVQSRVAPLEL